MMIFIANEDLKLRGPGDLFGIRQSGLMDFRIGDVFQDSELLKKQEMYSYVRLSIDRCTATYV